MTPEHLNIILSETLQGAHRLRRRLDLPPADLDDVAQDLRLDLIRRLPKYDRSLGALGPFAGTVIRNRSSRIATRIRSARRRTCGPIASLDEGMRGAHLEAVVPEKAGLWAVPDLGEMSERRLVVSSVLSHLDDEDLDLCIALASASVTDLVRSGRYSRSTLYRRAARLRCTFAAWGLSDRGAL
ncbi:sigma factor [Oceaniglobus roseus]|uniref:sigma factor n=1 Tax=Oceaniglobus roseus TaxID=1737570 RepID=UPI000C7EB2DC|nr:sigma factor [Kandeliimicrobium roseum]